jgi:hypothetical protein
MNIENGGEMYEFDKVYNFDLTEWLNIGGWTKEEVDDLMLDGRFTSHLLERQIPKWWPSLIHVKGCKAFDHKDKDSGERFDAKNLTKNGCKYMPSNMIGEGRTFDKEAFYEKAKDMNYIVCDIVDYPMVRVVFKCGSALLNQFPKGIISKVKGRKELFDGG